ncbi:MAG: FHA domain-containing protein [Hyphomicrobiales bacterium]
MKFGVLRVVTPDGQSQEFPLDLATVIVGRGPGNGVTIEDLSVARRHARLTMDSGHLFVEDLGSANGTFLGGQRLEPNTRYLVEDLSDLRFGDVQVTYTAPPPILVDQPALITPTEELPPEDGTFELPPTIRATLVSPTEAVDVGSGAAVAYLTVQNRGRVVDEVSLQVGGMPAEWVRLSEMRFPLLPGEQREVTLVIQPPRSYASRAGDYDFTVAVLSAETGREVLATGRVTLLPFPGTVLSLQPVRSKRDFTLIAENNGNATVTYGLDGVDDEEAFVYEFGAPGLELDPGEQEKVPFRVLPQKRQWFGRPQVAPFKVVATPSGFVGEKATVEGQLSIQPPLEKFKRPAMMALLALLALLGALAVLLLPGDGKNVKEANAEAAYEGVHLCDKDHADEREDNEKVQETALAQIGADDSGSPFFAQNDPKWGDEEYAKAQDPEFGPDWCGSTIAQCGCAMTSVATVMALFELVTMPDGEELTPQTLNEWLNGDAEKTPRGWVSRGYIYGDVIWTAANQLSAEIAQKYPGARTIRFAGTGTGSEEEIRSELKAGRPIILEVPGHWIAAVGLDGDQILINDPFYRDRRTLDVYKGLVRSSVKFQPSDDLSAVVITAPSDVRIRVTDKEGRVVGTLNDGTPQEAEQAAQKAIPGSSYDAKEAWRDPNCIASPPPAGAGTNQIILPGNRDDYKIEVLDAGDEEVSFAVHAYTKDGDVDIETQNSNGPAVVELEYDPNDGIKKSEVIEGATPSPEPSNTRAGLNQSPRPGGSASASPSGTVTPGGSGTPGSGTGTTSPTGTGTAGPSPTGTATPTPPPILAPSSVDVSCGVAYSQSPKNAVVTCNANIQGDYSTTRWTVNGVQFAPATGKTTLTTNFTSNTTATIGISACNVTMCTSSSRPVTVNFDDAGGGTSTPPPTTPPPPPPPTGPAAPTNVQVVCSATSSVAPADINCTVTAVGGFTSISWQAAGGSPASGSGPGPSFSTFRDSPGTVTVSVTACSGSACTTASAVQVTLTEALIFTSGFISPGFEGCAGEDAGFYAYVFLSDESFVPEGTVQLLVDGSVVDSQELTSESPAAFFYTLPEGTHTVSGRYLGTSTYASTELEGLEVSACSGGGGGGGGSLITTVGFISPGFEGCAADNAVFYAYVMYAGQILVEEGTVQLLVDGAVVDSQELTYSSAAAFFYTLPGGTHVVSGQYLGTSTYASTTLEGVEVVSCDNSTL